jgi:hypothetical protein
MFIDGKLVVLDKDGSWNFTRPTFGSARAHHSAFHSLLLDKGVLHARAAAK